MSTADSGTTPGKAGDAPENAAWASMQIPLAAERVSEFVADVGRLFRLNPHLDISEWQEQAGPGETHRCRLCAFNDTNGWRGEVSMRVEQLGSGMGYTLAYDGGMKRSTEFRIAPADDGATLTITEHYHPISSDSDERLREVDRSLIPWAAAIRRHLTGLARFGRWPGYRWWTERVMLGMPPRQRRIVRMIVWVSVLEFVVFMLVALIFWAES